MPPSRITAAEKKYVGQLVSHYESQEALIGTVLNQVVGVLSPDAQLNQLIHSIRYRLKDPEHLRDKLYRKMRDADGRPRKPSITTRNLFTKINDLAGVRLLHLYTRQFEHINLRLLQILDEFGYELIEGPVARTWDDESRAYFTSLDVRCKPSDNMYTSVHYVIAPNMKKQYTCEIQVRTLAEELWGEVDHTINYPHPSDSLPCREQIKVLARVTSSCSRLVDAIFTSHKEHKRDSSS